jgi:hypothetical protein
LQTPSDRVSGRAKKLSKAFFAFSLYLKAPAHPLADPKTSEFEKPPTATMKLISSKVSLPSIRSALGRTRLLQLES